MARINVLCLAFVFVLNMVEQEVSGSRCRCTSYCTIKQSQTSYYYKKCGFLWMRRCKKSYVKFTQFLIKPCDETKLLDVYKFKAHKPSEYTFYIEINLMLGFYDQ